MYIEMYRLTFDYKIGWVKTRGPQKGERVTKIIKGMTKDIESKSTADAKREIKESGIMWQIARDHFATIDRKRMKIPQNARVFGVGFNGKIRLVERVVYNVSVRAKATWTKRGGAMGSKTYNFLRSVEYDNKEEKKDVAERIAQQEFERLNDRSVGRGAIITVESFRFFRPSDEKFVKPGDYAITMRIHYRRKVADAQPSSLDVFQNIRIISDDVKEVDVELLDEKKAADENIDAIIRVGPNHTIHDLADKFAYEYIEEPTIPTSPKEYLRYENFNITPLADTNLADVPMRQSIMKYEFNTDQIVPTGECVIDYILHECRRKKKLVKTLTRPKLITFFGNVEQGITTNQLVSFGKEFEISIHAMSPMFEEFATYVPQRPKLSLYFIVNNGHCHGITNDELKKSIGQKHMITMGNFLFAVKYNEAKYFEDKDSAVNAIMTENKTVVLVSSGIIGDVMHELMTRTRSIIYNIKFSNNDILAFEDPVKKNVVMVADDYHERLAVCQSLTFDFTNQSWTQIAKSYFVMNHGRLRESEYSSDLFKVMKDYSMKGYICKLADESEFTSFDICRCYTSILLDNDVDYPVFTVFDMIEDFDGRLLPGEYYIEQTFYMGDGTIKISRGFYPLVFIKYVIEKGYISAGDISYMIRARDTYKADAFAGFAAALHAKFPSDSKMLINSWIGDLKRDKIKKTLGCITDHYQTCLGVMTRERELNRQPRMKKLGDVYFIRSNVTEERYMGHQPIWRHIIASGLVRLDKMHSALKIMYPGMVVLAYNVDSIKVKPVEAKRQETYRPGEIRVELDAKAYRGRFMKDLKEYPAYSDIDEVYYNFDMTGIDLEWRYFEEDLEFIKNNSVFVTGKGGSGKTWTISQTFDKEKDLCLVCTYKARDVLDRVKVPSEIFASFFTENHAERMIAKLEKYESIYVDEMSMVSSKYYALLVRARMRYPHLKFKLFGQCLQCRPVENRWHNYDSAKAIKYLTSYNRMELSYKGKRYDQELSDVLDHLAQTGKLKDDLREKKTKKCYTSICMTNDKRHAINAECYQRFVQEFKTERCVIGGREFAVGMPVVINEHGNRADLKVYNSQRYKVTGFDDGLLLGDRRIPAKDIDIVDYGFAMTVYKMQGDEIADDYCIWEIGRMTINELYTALSRGKALSKVHFDYTNRQFELKKPPTDIRMLQLRPEKLIGKIYCITDGERYYIGRTTRTLEERFEEHKISKVKKIREFMQGNVRIELIREIAVYEERELSRYEDMAIRDFADRPLLNGRVNVRLERAMDIKVDIQQMDLVRFKITKDEKQRMFRIRYNDGEKVDLKFRYKSCGEDVAYQKALEKQRELLKKYSVELYTDGS